jgi:hypothetical protein
MIVDLPQPFPRWVFVCLCVYVCVTECSEWSNCGCCHLNHCCCSGFALHALSADIGCVIVTRTHTPAVNNCPARAHILALTLASSTLPSALEPVNPAKRPILEFLQAEFPDEPHKWEGWKEILTGFDIETDGHIRGLSTASWEALSLSPVLKDGLSKLRTPSQGSSSTLATTCTFCLQSLTTPTCTF